MRTRWIAVFVSSIIVSIGCNSKEIEQPPTTYTQDFVTPTALVFGEINDSAENLGSAFLIDAKFGLFLTAKHVTDATPPGRYLRLFFNGSVYSARIVKTGALHDATLLQIVSSFDSSTFPPPYKLATSLPKRGETLRVQGFHVHPQWFIEKQKQNNHIEKPISVLSEYYHINNRRSSIVFEELATTVTNISARKVIGSPRSQNSYMKDLLTQANAYIELRVTHNHPIPYQGLSGGPILNSRGEIVAIVTGATKLEQLPYPTAHFIYATSVPALSILLLEIDSIKN